MSEPKPVKFTVRSGEPTVIEVETEDGRTYTLRGALAVFQVVETGQTAPDGLPAFGIKANIAFDTQEKK